MGFICNDCHKNYKGFHFSTVSYGRCEDCGKQEECYECKCDYVSTEGNLDINKNMIK